MGVDPDWKFVCNQSPQESVPRTIVICSDGIFEATNRSGKQFGKQGVYELLPEIVEMSSEKAVSRIIEEIQSHVKGVALDDDITVVVIKIN